VHGLARVVRRADHRPIGPISARYYPGATGRVVCRAGYSATVRHVPESVKERVYRAYGIRAHRQGRYEIDHLVPLAAGGSNSIANLFPEAARPRPGFHEKDRLEVAVRHAVCDRGARLRSLQRRIARDWVALSWIIHASTSCAGRPSSRERRVSTHVGVTSRTQFGLPSESVLASASPAIADWTAAIRSGCSASVGAATRPGAQSTASSAHHASARRAGS
jgi:hypothetical protein